MNKTVLYLLTILSIGSGQLTHAASTAPLLVSQIDGIALVAIDELPLAPADRGDVSQCTHLTVTPTNKGAEMVQSRGWTVTGETVLGEYDVISFVGGFVAGTSGSCELVDDNVGIFRADALIALAYGRNTTTGTIGSIAPLENAGARLWNGDYLPYPVADRLLDGDTIKIAALASVDPVCGGAAEVPNIYGMPIGESRKLLRTDGWLPIEGAPLEGFDGRATDLREQGMVEIEGCSGTGFGYCSFAYESSAGTLSVSTAGESEPPGTPSVFSYAVSCRPLR